MDAIYENLIRELRQVVVDLHRSAGILDDIIQDFEQSCIDGGTKEFFDMYVRCQARYREDYKNCRGYANLDEKEKTIWQTFIDSTKSES